MSENYRRFGDVALELKLVTSDALSQALITQAERRTRGVSVQLGQILLEQGAIDEEGIRQVLDVLYPVKGLEP